MPSLVTLRNGSTLLLDDFHDALVGKIIESRVEPASDFIRSAEWDDYSLRSAGAVTVRVDEIASIVDKPTRPRI